MTRQVSILLVSALSYLSSRAEVRQVPSEYATIQDALNALAANDTVLVDTGTYAEDLIVPNQPFTLMGNVEADTGDYPRPVLDPSSLPNPTGRRCMRLAEFAVHISHFVFRNRAPMYPHSQGESGGIRMGSASLTLEGCLFDSVYYGILSLSNSESQTVTLTNCDFVHSTGRCIFAPRIVADFCSFHSDTVDWAQLTFGNRTRIEYCSFTGDFWGGNVLLGAGNDISISYCTFSRFEFAPASGLVRLRLGASEVVGNVFADFPTGQGVLGISIYCHEPSVRVDSNIFRNLHTPRSHSYLSAIALWISSGDSLLVDCAPALVVNNILENCRTGQGPAGLSVGINAVAEHNRIRNVSGDDTVGCIVSDEFPIRLRDNIFQEDGIALATDGHTMFDAEYNYWGDSTGPYHPTLNPSGLGDEVGDFVDFDPWYTDTLFWNSSSPEPHPQLPNEVTVSVFPNPFNSTATLELYCPKAQMVEVKLNDLLGREVKQLFKGPAIDVKRISVDAHDLASGIYFARASDPIRRRALAETKLFLIK